MHFSPKGLLKLDTSLLPSDFLPPRHSPVPLLKRLQTPSPVTCRFSPAPARETPEAGKTTPLGKLSYRRVYVRTYRYRAKEKPSTPLPQQSSPSQRVFKCYWSKLPYNEGRPEVREGSGMCECCGSLYLYGGLSKTVYSDLYVLHADNQHWQPVECAGLEPDTRYGHSFVERGPSVVLFGGALNANPKRQLRECYNSVRVLEPLGTTKAQWKQLTTIGPVVEMRRYHAAAIVGRHMLVTGGLNQKNKVLEDCAVLDLETGRWELRTLCTGPLAICCHTAASVIEAYVKVTGVDDSILCEQSSELKQRGIYIFGGMDSQGVCCNTLRCIRPGPSGLESRVIETTGKPPAARCQHSMVFSRFANTLVLFGGKMPESKLNAASVFKDLHVLDLTNLHWSQAIVGGHLPRARWAHSCGSLQDKIVLFGGIEVSQFSSNETFILTLTPSTDTPVHMRVFPTLPTARAKSAERVKVKHRTYLL